MITFGNAVFTVWFLAVSGFGTPTHPDGLKKTSPTFKATAAQTGHTGANHGAVSSTSKNTEDGLKKTSLTSKATAAQTGHTGANHGAKTVSSTSKAAAPTIPQSSK